MAIDALQFNTSFAQEVIGKVEEERTKDFDKVLKKAMDGKDDRALKDACSQLESYMLSQLFKQMKKSTVSEEGLIPKGDYEKTFEDYMINNQCEEMVKAGGIGLADMMYKQMITTYGKQAQAKDDTENTQQVDQGV
jgi:flagellar protein FlgJ